MVANYTNSSAFLPGEQTKDITLSTYTLAALAAVIAGSATSSTEPELEFLQQKLETVTANKMSWMESLQAYLHQPSVEDLPLINLSQELELSLIELLTVALAVAVEENVMVDRALARLQAPLGGSRPTLGLLGTALAKVAPGLHPLHVLVTGVAVQSGLLKVMNETSPLPERTVSVPLHLCLALKNYDGYLPNTTIGLGQVPEVPLAASTLAEAQLRATSLQTSSQKVLVLRTGSIAEGKSVAVAIAQSLNCRPVFIETDQITSLEPWLLLRQLLPVFCYDLAPGEHKILPSLQYYHKPVLLLCGPDGSIEATQETPISWSLAVPKPDERQQLWQIALGDEQLATDLALNHRHSSGRIAQLGRLAHHHRTLAADAQLSLKHILAAAWTGEGVGLDALAQPLTDAIPDAALVMTPALREELDILLLRCQHRDRLVENLGLSTTTRYRPGVRALFVGPSGTGKTLAASWLATKLGIPIYRVDLAAITSKYIGETEKNLAQLMARAEQAEVALLFDEADSLFGKRTDVKDANDRFANAQTNYLLQRIESFDGITLLTSNSRNRFDSAFSRRLDFIIEFPLPGPEERRSLWQSHLGNNHYLTQRDFNQLAAMADLGGGHIRNAVLTAAILAQSQNRVIKFTDVLQGLMGEYRKLGQQMPPGLSEGMRTP